MKKADLSNEIVNKIKTYRFDRIIEKHEGPEKWEVYIKYGEFMNINGFEVLLPFDEEHHKNITILRCIESMDSNTLTIFLKDITYYSEFGYEHFYNGFLIICEKFPIENFYITTVYHEWFIINQ